MDKISDMIPTYISTSRDIIDIIILDIIFLHEAFDFVEIWKNPCQDGRVRSASRHSQGVRGLTSIMVPALQRL